MKTFLLLLGLTVSAWAQLNNPPLATPFTTQLYNLAAPDSSKSRLLIALAVLHDDLSFAKTDSGFGAQYELALQITGEDGNWIAGREEKKRIQARSFAETNSRRNFSVHNYQFDLPPGKYRVAINLIDRISGATAQGEITKELQAFSGNKKRLALSDLVLLDNVSRDSLQRIVITPRLLQNFATPESELRLYLEMFSADQHEPLKVRQTIRNWKQQVVVEQQKEWLRHSALEPVLLPIWIDALPYGTYEIEMKVRQGKAEKVARARFHLTWNGIPNNGVHLDQALTLAEHIAAAHEREQLQAARRDYSKEQKRELLRAFWETRDETPETPEIEAMGEYYQRIEFANEKFSAGRREGWQTDFGKIFVTYGAPDAVDLVNGNTPAALVQVWYYRRLDRRFSFIDYHGTGDYRLLPN